MAYLVRVCPFAIALLVRGLSSRPPQVVSVAGFGNRPKSVNGQKSKEILDAWQKTADRAAAGTLDQARIRKIVLETVERVTGKANRLSNRFGMA